MADITLTGNLGRDAELSFTPNGKAKLEFSVGDTPRRLNRDTNQWEDAGETTWWRVTEWGDKAEALADHLRKGDKVLVTGTAGVRTYEKKDGTAGWSAEIKPRQIAIIPKPQRNAANTPPAQSASQGWGGQQQAAPAQDPWGAPAGGNGGWGNGQQSEVPF